MSGPPPLGGPPRRDGAGCPPGPARPGPSHSVRRDGRALRSDVGAAKAGPRGSPAGIPAGRTRLAARFAHPPAACHRGGHGCHGDRSGRGRAGGASGHPASPPSTRSGFPAGTRWSARTCSRAVPRTSSSGRCAWSRTTLRPGGRWPSGQHQPLTAGVGPAGGTGTRPRGDGHGLLVRAGRGGLAAPQRRPPRGPRARPGHRRPGHTEAAAQAGHRRTVFDEVYEVRFDGRGGFELRP